MKFMDELKPLFLYPATKKVFIPINMKNKKKDAAIFLLTRNVRDSMNLMNRNYIYNPSYYTSYYIDRDAMAYIDNTMAENRDQDDFDEVEANAVSEAIVFRGSAVSKLRIEGDKTCSWADREAINLAFGKDGMTYLHKTIKLLGITAVPAVVNVYTYNSITDLRNSIPEKAKKYYKKNDIDFTSYHYNDSIHTISALAYRQEYGGPYDVYLMSEVLALLINLYRPTMNLRTVYDFASAISKQTEWYMKNMPKQATKTSIAIHKYIEKKGVREVGNMINTGNYNPLIGYMSRGLFNTLIGFGESGLSVKQRNALPSTDFGIPSLRKYPMPDKDHVRSAIRFFNHVDKEYEEELAKAIKTKIRAFKMEDEINVGSNNRFSKYYTAPVREAIERTANIDNREINKRIAKKKSENIKENPYEKFYIRRDYTGTTARVNSDEISSMASGNVFESLAKTNPTAFNTAKLKMIRESEDIVDKFNAMVLDSSIKHVENTVDAVEKHDQKNYNVLINVYIRAMMNLQDELKISDEEASKLILGAYMPGSLTPEGCKKLIDARIAANRFMVESLKEFLKKDYALLNLSEAEVKALMQDLDDDAQSSFAINHIQKRLKDENTVAQFKVKPTVYDFTKIGGGHVFYSRNNDDMYFAAHPSKILPDIMKYDAIIAAHGGYDEDKTLENNSLNSLKKRYNFTISSIIEDITDFAKYADAENRKVINRVSDNIDELAEALYKNKDQKDIQQLLARNPDKTDEKAELRGIVERNTGVVNVLYKNLEINGFINKINSIRKLKGRYDESEINDMAQYIEELTKRFDYIMEIRDYTAIFPTLLGSHFNSMTMRSYESVFVKNMETIVELMRKVNSFKEDIKGVSNNNAWVIEAVDTLQADNITSVPELLRQLKKEGFKNVYMMSCNPGNVPIPADIRNDKDFHVKYNSVSQMKEAVELDEVEQEIALIESSIDNIYKENNIPDVGKSYNALLKEYEQLNIDYTLYLNEGAVFQESVLDTLKKIGKKAIELILRLWRMIVDFFKNIWTRIKGLFIKDNKQDPNATKKASKPVEVSAITIHGDKAVIEKKTVNTLDEAKNVILAACKNISNFITSRSNKENTEIKKIQTDIERGNFKQSNKQESVLYEAIERTANIDNREINRRIAQTTNIHVRRHPDELEYASSISGVGKSKTFSEDIYSMGSGNVFEALAKTDPTAFNTAKLKEIRESENIVDTFNNTLWEAVTNHTDSKSLELSAQYQKEFSILAMAFRECIEGLKVTLDINEKEALQLALTAYAPGALTPEGCKKLIDARIAANKFMVGCLKEFLKKDYRLLNISEAEVKSLLSDLDNENTSGEAIKAIQEKLKKDDELEKFKVKPNVYDFTKLGGGHVFYTTKDNDAFDAGHPSKILSDIMKYDAVVTAHGNYDENNLFKNYSVTSLRREYNEIFKNLNTYLDTFSKDMLDKNESISKYIKENPDKVIDSIDRRVGIKDALTDLYKVGIRFNVPNDKNEFKNTLKEVLINNSNIIQLLYDRIEIDKIRSALSEFKEFKLNTPDSELEELEYIRTYIYETFTYVVYKAITPGVQTIITMTGVYDDCIPEARRQIDSYLKRLTQIKRNASTSKIKENIKGASDSDAWIIQPVNTLQADNITTIPALLRQLKKEGFKNVYLMSCNPGGVPLPPDIRNDKDFHVKYNLVSQLKEDAELDEVEQELALVESAIDDIYMENDIFYTGKSLDAILTEYEELSSVYDRYFNEGTVIHEGALDTLKAIGKKAIELILRLWRMIIDFFKNIWAKIKSLFIKDNKQDPNATKKASKPVEVNAITINGGKATIEKKTVTTLDEAKNVILAACKNISNFITSRSNKENTEIKKIQSDIENGNFKKPEQDAKQEAAPLGTDYMDILRIVDTLSRDEFKRISFYDTYRDSSFVVNRNIKKDVGGPAAFMDVYLFPSEPERAQITTATDPTYRGRGYCSKMLKELLDSDVAKDYNIKTYIWTVHPDNVASRRVAEKHGFVCNDPDHLDKYGRLTYFHSNDVPQNESTIFDSEVNETGGIIMDNGNIFLTEASDESRLKGYRPVFKKYIYNSRIRSNRALFPMYDNVKALCPFIKRTYPKLEKYANYNLYVDLYYYHNLFLSNTIFKLERGLRMYLEFLTRLMNNTRVNTMYSKKTYFIPVELSAWGASSVEALLDYKANLNPISLMVRLLRLDPAALRKTFGGKQIFFSAPTGYFVVDFNTFEFKNLPRFKRNITKLCSGEPIKDDEDFDDDSDTKDVATMRKSSDDRINANIASSKDKDSPKVITAKIINKVEKSIGVKLDVPENGERPKRTRTGPLTHLDIQKIDLKNMPNADPLFILSPSSQDAVQLIKKLNIKEKYYYYKPKASR